MKMSEDTQKRIGVLSVGRRRDELAQLMQTREVSAHAALEEK